MSDFEKAWRYSPYSDEMKECADEFYRQGQAASEYRVKELTEALNQRSKQIGVACDKHDLIHSLVCGVCHSALQVKCDGLERERNEYGNALHDLWNAADDSDGSAYGTLSTKFVRDICKVALEVKKYV